MLFSWRLAIGPLLFLLNSQPGKGVRYVMGRWSEVKEGTGVATVGLLLISLPRPQQFGTLTAFIAGMPAQATEFTRSFGVKQAPS